MDPELNSNNYQDADPLEDDERAYAAFRVSSIEPPCPRCHWPWVLCQCDASVPF